MSKTIKLCPIEADDKPFLYRLYASTREKELAVVDWSETQKDAFLHMQFEAQHKYYRQHYRETTFDLIVLDDEPVGRLYLARWPDEFRIVDIALLPEWRNQGIGSRLLQDILQEAQEAGLPVSIHVECFNPALHLYYRLGFKKIADKGVYYLLEKAPSLS